MSNILIIENDRHLSKFLCQNFAKSGHNCLKSKSIAESIRLLKKKNFDLIILDRVLDDGDGLEISNYLNDLNASTRILFISDLGDTNNRIVGLEQGGDDYLPKPFSLIELNLKVNKMIRLHKNKVNKLILADIELDRETCTLTLPDSSEISLRPKEAGILAVLMRHKNQIVSRESIISIVWGSIENIPSYATIDAYIRKIRMKTKSSSTKITTHRGIGYKLV